MHKTLHFKACAYRTEDVTVHGARQWVYLYTTASEGQPWDQRQMIDDAE